MTPIPRAWRRSPTIAGTAAVLRLLPTAGRGKTALLFAGTFVRAALPIGVAVVTGLLVGSIPAALRDGPNSASVRATLLLLGLAALLIVTTRLVGPFVDALASVIGRVVDRHLQERAMTAVNQPVGIAHLEDPTVLDLVQNARGIGMEGRRPGDAVAALASLLPSWLQALGSTLILIAFHWWLSLAWIIMLPTVIFYLQREYLRVGKIASGQAAAVRRASYYRDLALTPIAAKEVRLWGMLDWLIERYDREWRGMMRPVWAARHPGRPIVWLTATVVTAVNLASLGLLAWSATRGDLDLAALAVFTQAVLGANGYRAFDDANAQLAYAAVSVPSLLALEQRLSRDEERMSGMPSHRSAPRRGGSTSVEPVPPDCPREVARFENVGFRYPGQSVDAFDGFELTIPAGRSLAIVGENGAGKTTLVKLLCRLYDPGAGQINVDGVDLRVYDPRSWRKQIAAIFQDFVQYPLSARENVALGAPRHASNREQLRSAAKRAGALELIESLPRGWDTVLSRQFGGGVELSGGQWQRVALARALFAVEAGARVLILDEPTASLDVRAEAELYDRFLEITAGLTTILISHRFSTVRRADQICVLAGGKIVEQGSHDALMSRGGCYAELFTLQASRFVDETEH